MRGWYSGEEEPVVWERLKARDHGGWEQSLQRPQSWCSSKVGVPAVGASCMKDPDGPPQMRNAHSCFCPLLVELFVLSLILAVTLKS